MATYGNPMMIGTQASGGGGNEGQITPVDQWRCGTYTGDGNANRAIILGEKPEQVFVYQLGQPPVAFVSNVNQIFQAFGVQTKAAAGFQKGLTLNDTGFFVLQTNTTPPDGKKMMLNESGKKYIFTYKTVTKATTMDELPIGATLKLGDSSLPGGDEYIVVAQNHYGSKETLFSCKKAVGE
ncbi:MAG: hypothetical protein Q4A76_06345, partial [Porphyromonadaceae bacterium]|nr:hypothetical protein [Porphyromonadaceae bacterium]